jgi:hypothetical protein
MTRYIVIRDVIARRKPGSGLPLGWVRKDFAFNDVASVKNYVAFAVTNSKGKTSQWWVPAFSVSAVEPVITPPLPARQIRLKFHSQMPDEMKNYGSFGIVGFYAEAAKNKPHSVILNDGLVELYHELQSQRYYDENIQHYPCDNAKILNKPGQHVNPAASFQWLFEHNDTKNYGSHFTGYGYSIPAQGCFGGNVVTTGATTSDFTEAIGVDGINIPRIEDLYHRPDLVHFCWCVGKDGRTINPPCGSAFVLVLNPVGLQGVTNLFNQQSHIWFSNKWRWK